MKQRIRVAAILMLFALLLLSPAGRVQGTVTVTQDPTHPTIDVANANITFYQWYSPSPDLFRINPTFAWMDNKQPSVLYVADVLGLYEYREPNSTSNDGAFQRNEVVTNGSFSWVGNENWSFGNFTVTKNGATYNYQDITLQTSNHTGANFKYLAGNTTLSPTVYGTVAGGRSFYGYNYDAGQARTDVFFNLTKWNWNAVSPLNHLALMIGLYAVNTTLIQKLGINLNDYVIPEYNIISPEEIVPRYLPLNASAFLLSGMNLTASNGATTSGGAYSLKANETLQASTSYEHRLNYTLPKNSTTSTLPFVKLQFSSGNTTLPGYFSFPGFAVGLDSNTGKKHDTFNVTSSYLSTGNYLRIFLGYPQFNVDQLRHFFSLGVDDNYLPPQPTQPAVYIVLPSLPFSQALIIGGIAVVSIAISIFATRMVRRAGLEAKK